MASQTGSLSLKMNRLTCHHRGPGWAARDEQLLLQRNHHLLPTLTAHAADAPCTRCTPAHVHVHNIQVLLHQGSMHTHYTHELWWSHKVSGIVLTCCCLSSPSLLTSEACKLPRKKKQAARVSGLNTVPIVRVLPSKFGSDAAYVHARVAFFVWQMRRTGQAVVPW